MPEKEKKSQKSFEKNFQEILDIFFKKCLSCQYRSITFNALPMNKIMKIV